MTDPVALSQAMIRVPSVTPDQGDGQDALAEALEGAGFIVWRHLWGEAPDGPVANLFARRGSGGPHFAFAGHTDVVPPGDADDWQVDPFAARSPRRLAGRSRCQRHEVGHRGIRVGSGGRRHL